MIVLKVRNVHQALPQALRLLESIGIERDSRNGPVLQAPEPVATVYTHPCERVMFWPERDANPFLHLYESLWMLAGRNDLAPLLKYRKGFADYSDDGETLHGAYGHRWRVAFGFDQLVEIAESLKANPTDRRCVLQMWDARLDLGREGKDLPCNDTATFQIGTDSRLDLVVFCRSNDIVWGCYGANAVHFSFLLEYMALWIGVPVGTYTQISVNWHGYLSTLEKVWPLTEKVGAEHDYYMPTSKQQVQRHTWSSIQEADYDIATTLAAVDSDFKGQQLLHNHYSGILFAHHLWKTAGKDAALISLANMAQTDWTRATTEWLERRRG